MQINILKSNLNVRNFGPIYCDYFGDFLKRTEQRIHRIPSISFEFHLLSWIIWGKNFEKKYSYKISVTTFMHQ